MPVGIPAVLSGAFNERGFKDVAKAFLQSREGVKEAGEQIRKEGLIYVLADMIPDQYPTAEALVQAIRDAPVSGY